MNYYLRHGYPRMVESTLSTPKMDEHRRELLAEVRGRVLEIGFGSGLNLPFYPAGVQEVVAADVNPGMWRLAVERARAAPFPVRLHLARAESLPFASGAFDAVVSTWTLCSVGPAERALAEVRRVLTPDGRFYFFEHGISPQLGIRLLQYLAEPGYRIVAAGCHLTRDFRRLIEAQNMIFIREREFVFSPYVDGFIYTGVATRPPER
jgi:ubiquinone/menaquinone biosynthesis C-methylase UbiE